jgi:hypothetical protein
MMVTRGFRFVCFLDLMNRFGQGGNEIFEAELGALAFQEFRVCCNQVG